MSIYNYYDLSEIKKTIMSATVGNYGIIHEIDTTNTKALKILGGCGCIYFLLFFVQVFIKKILYKDKN